jgi:hypothetical protein
MGNINHPQRLRVLTWHVHGNYLYYLTQAPHDFYVVCDQARSPGYAGRSGCLPWGRNVLDAPLEDLSSMEFDCVLTQSRRNWEQDREEQLSAAQKGLPRIHLEHDPPQESPTNSRHFVDDKDTLLVHCTHFNRLMWDNGKTPTAVIEHGVFLPQPAKYRGELERGIVVVNHLARRGRRLGADVFGTVRRTVPLDLVGMDAEALGGIGEIANLDLPGHMAAYRFFFHPIRYTSLGLALIEAMMIGIPVVALATTELATVLRDGVTGYIDTRIDKLIESMTRLLRSPDEARAIGAAGQRLALERFNIERFVDDWDRLLRDVAG